MERLLGNFWVLGCRWLFAAVLGRGQQGTMTANHCADPFHRKRWSPFNRMEGTLWKPTNQVKPSF